MLIPITLANGTVKPGSLYIRFSVHIRQTFVGMNFLALRSVSYEANQGNSCSGLEWAYRNWR
jgi:hypothetical protein